MRNHLAQSNEAVPASQAKDLAQASTQPQASVEVDPDEISCEDLESVAGGDGVLLGLGWQSANSSTQAGLAAFTSFFR